LSDHTLQVHLLSGAVYTVSLTTTIGVNSSDVCVNLDSNWSTSISADLTRILIPQNMIISTKIYRKLVLRARTDRLSPNRIRKKLSCVRFFRTYSIQKFTLLGVCSYSKGFPLRRLYLGVCIIYIWQWNPEFTLKTIL